MKKFLLNCIMLCYCCTAVMGQKKALNIPGLHQLVSYSKSENKLQKTARDKQTVTTANEEANKTMLARLKVKYRELHDRYSVLGTVLSAANIGLQAVPMVNRVIANQRVLFELARANPALLPFTYRSEIELIDKANRLVSYLVGLTISIGDINQMKASDRKMLFDFILVELSTIQELSANLVHVYEGAGQTSLIRSLNPFRDYISQDKAIVAEIIQNAKYLKE